MQVWIIQTKTLTLNHKIIPWFEHGLI
jgi:hypothetical protein